MRLADLSSMPGALEEKSVMVVAVVDSSVPVFVAIWLRFVTWVAAQSVSFGRWQFWLAPGRFAGFDFVLKPRLQLVLGALGQGFVCVGVNGGGLGAHLLRKVS